MVIAFGILPLEGRIFVESASSSRKEMKAMLQEDKKIIIKELHREVRYGVVIAWQCMKDHAVTNVKQGPPNANLP